MEKAEIETETVPSILLPCASCTRTFRPEALAKHSKVCEKILMKKRKQFDSSKQRLQGTEIESFVQTVPKTSRKKDAQLNLSKSKWKEKVEQVRAIQAVKKPIETPLSQVVKPSDHEECPYCGRSFGPKAYERHTEFCKEQIHKLKVSSNCNSEARERLKVRTTYRGPLTNKVLNRDRYQPNRNRDPSPLGLSSSEIYVTDETPKSRGLSRNSSLRSSLRSKPETTPPPPLRRTMTQINPSSKGARRSPKELYETDLLQKTQTLNNKPRMISKEPNEKRMKPTNSKTIAQPSSKPTGSNPKSPPKLNNIDVNTFKELNVISCFTSSSKSYNSVKLINNHHSSVVVGGTINSEAPLNAVPENENATFYSLKAGNCFKPIIDLHSETALNAVPQSANITSDLPKDCDSKLTSYHHQSGIVTPDLPKVVDYLKSIDDHNSPGVVQETEIYETPLNVFSPSEISSPDLLTADHCFTPVNNHHSSVIAQETIKPETSTNADRKNNLTPTDIDPFTEETLNQTDHTKSCNKNLAFTIEFEPDNRFLVYEHHKVGLKKSPLIFKKRVSKSYESVKQYINDRNNFEGVEIKTNATSELEEPLENKNLSVINKVESSVPNVTQNCEVKIAGTDNLETLNPSLSWRERVLEIMEISGSSSDKSLNTSSSKNPNQIDPCSVSGSKSVESLSEEVKKTNEPNFKDKYTDTDNSLLIDQELINIFCSNKTTLESFGDVCLDNGDITNTQIAVNLDSEEKGFIDEKNNKSCKIEGSSDDMGTLQNYLLDADLYFDEENSEEIGKILKDNILDVDVYFTEENNVANEVLREETMECSSSMSVNECDESSSLTDFGNKNVCSVLEDNNLVDPIEVNLENEVCNEKGPHINNGYETNQILEEGNINSVNHLGNTEKVLEVSFVNKYEFNDHVDIVDEFIKNQSETFTKDNVILENVASSSASHIVPNIEKTNCFRSLSDSELQKKQFTENEEIIRRDLETTFENEGDALSFGKPENEDSPTLVKDKILKLAGQEFVLMANRNKECDIFEGSHINHYGFMGSEKTNMHSQIKNNNLYHGSYKPNTYCLNTHTNSYKDSGEISSDIFSHLKRSNEEGPKITNWQTLPYGSDCYTDCESLSEKDSLDIKFEEDISDEFYILKPGPPYDDRAPFETGVFNHRFKDFSSEDARYSSSSSSSSYNSGDQMSMNKNPIISPESSSGNSSVPFTSSKGQSHKWSTSSRIPLLKSRRNGIYKPNTLPPLFAEPKTMPFKCDKQNDKKKYDFSQCSDNSKNNCYTHFSNIKNSSEESASDWDLSDYDTYEKKKTVFTRSSKTVYNKYYEQVEYSQESNEYQTIKTSVSNLPLPHADFFKEKEFKLPKIQPNNVPLDQRVHKKKMTDFEKLPLLRNFEDCKWCFPHVVRHVITTVLPKRFSIEDAEKYNPYLSAERQMLELFGTDDGKGKTSLPEIHHSSPILSSPISAFVKYSSPKRAPSVESLKSDNKENNNMNPDVIDFPPVGDKIDNHKNFSLSNLSLCSVVSIDSIDCNKNSFNSKLSDSHLDDFQRSFSAIESKSNRTVVKPKVNLQQMLYGSHTISPEQSVQKEGNNSDTENLEACEAELLISMLEFEKMLKSSPPSSPETSPNLCSSSLRKEKETDEDLENRNHKFLNNSIDSAYSSLTRSSGAEGDTGKAEMSRFCHECGAKYPIAGAKFCCNCGMRRITL